MAKDAHKTSKTSFTAVVVVNKKIGSRFYKLVLHLFKQAADAFANTQPGQFAEIDLSSAALPPADQIPNELSDRVKREIILRRPFSFSSVDAREDKTVLEIIYCIVGPASLRLTTVIPEQKLNIIGPLGNGFNIPDNKTTALLVAGGMGTPPLQHLAKILSEKHPEIYTVAFAGAKSKSDLPFEGRTDEVSEEIGYPIQAFAKYGIESQVATNDGSAGYNGPVTGCLNDWLKANEKDPSEIIIYACGPEAMLADVAKLAAEKNIDCQISMERRMACGIGVCQSCAVECKVPDSNETVYKLCCEDGPVFNAKEVVFLTEKNSHKL
ncbi:MAG: dihydroorotate dehydrogenase electron transfer subunit [Sedimentisphaerales bacterium]|nr:dihydroorotate dehydrogenase electron transfer subunit [Sedimentisphaerales bacterium]